MHALLTFRLATRRKVRERIEWREGCLDALAERLFPDLPAKVDKHQVANRTTAYQHGYQWGKTRPVAVNLPETEEQFDGEDQYGAAAWVSAALVVIALITLYHQTH